MKVKIILLFLIMLFALNFFSARDFSVDNVLLKSNLKEGDFFEKTIKITNKGSDENNFEIISNADFILLSETKFNLASGESKDIIINFDIQNKLPGVYLGKLIIKGQKSELDIPVIIEIETKEVFFDSITNIPLEYIDVSPGGKILVESQIFNLENIGEKNIEINYLIMDFDGNTFFSENENTLVKRDFLITKSVNLPEDIESGDFIFIITSSYGDSLGVSSSIFRVSEKKTTSSFNDNYYIWIVFILLLVIILFILYNQRQNDKLLLELSRQHGNELKKESESFERKKQELKKLPLRERKVKLVTLHKIKRKRVKVIKRIYRSRVKIVKKLRKQHKESEIEKKMGEWKKQGFNVGEFLGEEKTTKLDISKLKKQGYKF